MTIREKIITALVELLGGNSPAPVSRSLNAALRPEDLPVIVVRPTDESVEPAGLYDLQLRKLQLQAVCIIGSLEDTQEESAEPMDTKLDSILESVEKQIASAGTLDGLILNASVTGTQWHMEPGEEDFVGAAVGIAIEYFTQGDVSTSGA